MAMKSATQTGSMAQRLRVPSGWPKMTSASSGGFGTRTRPVTMATETAARRARPTGLLLVICSKVSKGDSSTPLRISRDARMVLNWDFLLRFGDIVLHQREGRKATYSEEAHEAEYGAPPNEWLGN